MTFLVEAARLGVDFRRTLTIGRQELKVRSGDLDRPLALALALAPACPAGRFAEPVFAALGAETVDALDASPYEGPAIVHDLNEPVDASLHGSYTCVYDGGSLEHVFNFPVAIKSCMEMVMAGGHLLLQSPANNQCGHGFYQFSPELVYRVLSPDNGFRSGANGGVRAFHRTAVPGGRSRRHRRARRAHQLPARAAPGAGPAHRCGAGAQPRPPAERLRIGVGG